ncbi:MAG: hypothetical protein QGH51_08830 [Planctomycetota bacterium]|jgi:hypothetical protein|nr:hypothetical protein [Planctomycetota bacterium]MDP6942113.1 hypothetical protein [Planctomycetota bacterium]
MANSSIQRRLIPRKRLPEFGLKLPKDTVYVNVFTAVRENSQEEAHFLTIADAEEWLATSPKDGDEQSDGNQHDSLT